MTEQFHDLLDEKTKKILQRTEMWMEHRKKAEPGQPVSQSYVTEEEVRYLLGTIYEEIKGLLKEYIDMREDYYDLVSTWIIGTWVHDSFNTYPYLFINAMRGSGKTRLMGLIKALSYKGTLNTSMREAVLFRMGKRTLCLDEFEGVGNKEAQAIREILNASYKKGIKIFRMKKTRVENSDEFVIEEHEPYKPICMANIWGMEEVLGDRCVTMILEKSSNNRVSRLIEDFDSIPAIKFAQSGLNNCLVQLCSFFGVDRYTKQWNKYINLKYGDTYTYTTLTTHITQTTEPRKANFTNPELQLSDDFEENEKLFEMFNKIDATGINGRNLELFMPLFVISRFISDDAFDRMLKIATDMTKEKKQNEMTESRDVILYDFIANRLWTNDFVPISKFVADFRIFVGSEEGEDKWITEKWVGRALKRLNLVIDKRRMANGMEIIPNQNKAREKLNLFKQEK